MPLYLVRWPGFEASIVRAESEEHLTDILDEVGDPGAATWTEYDGPLWVDVNLGLELEVTGDTAILSGVEAAATDPWFGASVQRGEGDSADGMLEAVIARAFPNLAQVERGHDEEPADPKKVTAAALMDLRTHRGSGRLAAYLEDLYRKHGLTPDDD